MLMEIYLSVCQEERIRVCNGFIRLEQGPVAGCCEDGSEHSSSIKGGECFV